MKINIDFWSALDDPGQPVDLRPLLGRAIAQPVAGRMKTRRAGYTDYLAEVQVDGETAVGLAARIRSENLPQKGNLETGELADLPLIDEEGVAEEVSFLYDHSLQVLATQRRQLFQATALAGLISDIASTDFYLQPKFRQDVWEKFGQMQAIASLDLKIAMPAHHPNFSRTIPSMGNLLDEAQEIAGATTVELILSVGKVRIRPLEGGLIRSIARLLRGRDNVKKLTVRGRAGDDEKSEVLDLLKGRLVFSGEVDYAGRRLDKKQCQQLLREAIRTHRTYLRSLLQ